MLFAKKKAVKAVIAGDLERLKQIVDKHPGVLEKTVRVDDSNLGRLLNLAVYHNQLAIIEYLVTEKNRDPNKGNGKSSGSRPLHHAAIGKAYAAAVLLVKLGADPSLTNNSGKNSRAFVNEALERDPAYQEKLRLEAEALRTAELKDIAERALKEEAERVARVAGKWTLTAPAEVTHEYDMADGSHRLKEIFNFRTRIWRSVVTDLATNALAQNIVFFDAMPDATILQEPLQKLKELGGTADESALPASALPKKGLKPAATP